MTSRSSKALNDGVVAIDDCEQIRSVQSAVKRIRKSDPSLRRLWLQRGIRCTRVEGRDLLAALQHATKTAPSTGSSSSFPSSHATIVSAATCPPLGDNACAVQSVRVCGGLYSGLREVAKWSSAVRVFAQLGNLQEFIVDPHLVIRDASSYLEMLHLLQPRVPTLVRLELNSRHCVNRSDIPAIVEALLPAQCLRDLVARDLVFNGDVDLSYLLMGIVRGLPNLETLDLVGSTASSERRPRLTADCVRTLCRSSLRSIKLRGLDLPCDGSALWAQELRFNTALRNIHLGGWSAEDPSEIHKSKFLLPVVETMMDHQWSLESFQVDVDSQVSRPNNDPGECLHLQQLNAICELNSSGRRSVVYNPNSQRKDWVELLAKSGGDVNALYWILLKNPCLCRPPRQRHSTHLNANHKNGKERCGAEVAPQASLDPLQSSYVFEVDL